MTRPLQVGLLDELVVDNFAGGGGASVAMEAALGRPVDLAINHDPEAVCMHMANHPYTRHFCEDVWSVNPRKVTAGRKVGLAWFSPDCKHFSKAKGGKPVQKKIRGLAWVVIRWAATVRPRVIILENVEEFKTWGPLVDNKPCPKRKGQTFNKWVNRLRELGYKVDWKELSACDYGAPTIRKRLFLVARCDGLPIVWPDPTHGSGTDNPYRTAAECIDWSIPCPSIFERKRLLAENTMKRIARGIKKFVIDAAEPFCITYYGPKTDGVEFRGFSVGDQVPTQTTENRFGLVMPYVVKHFGGMTGTEATNPFPTITARGTQNQLVTAFLQRHFGQGTGREVAEPAPTVTAGGMGKTSLVTANLTRFNGKSDSAGIAAAAPTVTTKNKTGLVTSHLVKLRGTCRHGQSVRQPMPTVTAGGLHVGEVRAFLLKYYGTAVGQDPRDSLHTITSNDRFGLVTVAGQDYQIVDIGMRMLAPRELYLAQGFDDSYIIDPAYNDKPLTKTAQVRMCGNSVSPPPAQALVEANYTNCIAMDNRSWLLQSARG